MRTSKGDFVGTFSIYLGPLGSNGLAEASASLHSIKTVITRGMSNFLLQPTNCVLGKSKIPWKLDRIV